MRVLTAVNGTQDVDGGGHAGVVAPPVDVAAFAAIGQFGRRIARLEAGQRVEQGGQCHAPHSVIRAGAEG